tara:strand:+ start:158 stop:424 length:267 start_codon:yes stop_codon:yes gene_type:complete
MICKKLKKTIEVYSETGEVYKYKTIFNKSNCYVKALFIDDTFDTFCIFEAELNNNLEHQMPEEVVVADTLEAAHLEWNELTYLHITQN